MDALYQVSVQFMVVLIVLNVAIALIIFVLKWQNVRRTKAEMRFSAKFKDYLHYIATNIESDERLRVPKMKLNKLEFAVLQERLNDMIENIAGFHRDKLVVLCADIGLIDYHLKRLESRSYRRKLDAAYHIGCMKVKKAAPALLNMLRNHKLNSSLFVIARAAAKCARSREDVKKMVALMLKHRAPFHDLLVDIIKEASVNHTALFAEFIHEQQEDLIKIGLTGLKENNEPGVASTVYRLMDSPDEEIQLKAVNVYLKSVHLIPKHVIRKLMAHTNPDIRLMMTNTLGSLKRETYVSELRQALYDADRRIVDAGTRGLVNCGQHGITALCQGALELSGKEQGGFIRSLIEGEINRLAAELGHVEKLTRYNSLVYAYEKYFGENKKIHRVV